MPVGDGDIVLGINLLTGLTQNVEIPPTDRNVRPIVLHPEYGLMTLTNIQEAFGGTLYNNNTELYEIESPNGFADWLIVNVPYIEMYGEEDNLNYTDTDTFNYQLNYSIINSSGDSQVDIALEPDTERGGGPGGSGGGGGGSGSGGGDGDGDGDGPEDIKPFPAPPENPDGLEHTCSDEEPPEPQPGEPGEPPEPGPPEEPCAACAAGVPKGGDGPTQTESGTLSGSGQNQMDSGESGESQGEGQGEGSGESQGEGSGEGSGSGEGQSQGEASGEGSGEGSGESSGSGQGQGEGPSSGSGEGEGEGQGEGSGEGSGEPSGESSGSGEPSDSGEGQPTPDNQSGEASGGSESAPPQDSLLQQLMDEQEARSQDGGDGPPTTPEDFMDDSTPSEEPSDNYDDIFDDTSPFGPDDDGPAMSPDDFMDWEPQDPSPSDDELPLTNDNMDDGNSYPLDEPSSQPRPFENLSDDELQQLIDELRETPEPTNPEDFMDEDIIDDVTPLPDMPRDGPMQPDEPDEPSTGPGEGQGEEPSNRSGQGDDSSNNDNLPESNDSSSSTESGQSWLWINVGTGELNSGAEAPIAGIWRHALYIGSSPSLVPNRYVMEFDDVRRLFNDNGEPTYYQPLPTMLSIEFDGAESYVTAQSYRSAMEGQYWDIESDDMSFQWTITLNYLEQSPDTEDRWVPMSTDQDGDITTPQFEESQSAAQQMMEQINQENQLANDRGIPTGYGEGSTSPFIPDNESNAALQQDAANKGADAGKADAQMAKEGASKETDSARQQAQQDAREAGQSNDLDSAMDSVDSAVENAQRANAAADPNNDEDVSNRNQAVAAANEALDSISELLQPSEDTNDEQLQEQLDAVRQSLNELEVGESSSLAQSFAEEAKKDRDKAVAADNIVDAANSAMEAVDNAVKSRESANEGDSKDRTAVQEATNVAQQALDAAKEYEDDEVFGTLMETQQELLDSIPPFNELPDLAVDAAARMRDTMPGEFADIDNPDVAEDMMAVAEQAVSNLEQAVSEANPSNQYDRDATEFIAEKTNATIANVEGSWSGDPEEIEELRERVNEALKEFSEGVENICALWNPNTMSWYRGTTGDILIFKDETDALIYGLQRDLIPVEVASRDGRELDINKEVKPIGVGGEI